MVGVVDLLAQRSRASKRIRRPGRTETCGGQQRYTSAELQSDLAPVALARPWQRRCRREAPIEMADRLDMG
jgi:hypothetical protein